MMKLRWFKCLCDVAVRHRQETITLAEKYQNSIKANEETIAKYKDILSVKKVFSNLIYISTLLNITEEEIKDACYKKQEIVEKRLSDDNY